MPPQNDILVKEETEIERDKSHEDQAEENRNAKLKHVRFADDCGHCLETVRVMTEPSDYPPKISPAVLRRFRRAAIMAAQKEGLPLPNGKNDSDSDSLDEENVAKKPRCTWKLNFKQPASEYIKFRETLESQKVALENVMLKNELGRMIGTIKVSCKRGEWNGRNQGWIEVEKILRNIEIL